MFDDEYTSEIFNEKFDPIILEEPVTISGPVEPVEKAAIGIKKRQRGGIYLGQICSDDIYESDIVLADDEVITNPQITMITINAVFTNIRFKESAIMSKIEPTDKIVYIDTNFGVKKYDSYSLPVKIRLSNKGRKPATPKPSTRKLQGDGHQFASQATFWIIPRPGVEPFKVKLFTQGKVVTTGITPETLKDCRESLEILRQYLLGYPDVFSGGKPIECIAIYPVLKNYKFQCNMNEENIMDVGMLKSIIEREQNLCDPEKRVHVLSSHYDRRIGNAISIDIGYNAEDGGMHKILFKIYGESGKINVQGAPNKVAVNRIIKSFVFLIENYYDEIVTYPGRDQPVSSSGSTV